MPATLDGVPVEALDGVPVEALRWVTAVMRPGSRITTVRRLPLGGWHTNHLVTITGPDGASYRAVLRRWARPGWQIDDPDYTAAREAHVLALLAPGPVPAPRVIAADLDGTICGVPALLLTCLPGHPPTRAAMADPSFSLQLAQMLAEIHTFGAVGLPGLAPYRLYFDPPNAAPPAWLPEQPIWQRAAQIVQAARLEPLLTLIHRDFHPENTLWSGNRITGVVDWTQASSGPAALDLGHLRWNLVLDHSIFLADQLLLEYQVITKTAAADQPYWDLIAVFDLLLGDDPTEPGDLDAEDQQRLTRYVKILTDRATQLQIRRQTDH